MDHKMENFDNSPNEDLNENLWGINEDEKVIT